jgi:hypothetical protein
MAPTKLEADYLVIGAGAMGMAFADTLVAETDATIAIVDRYARPGGHWTTAYPYVRLHQPSAYYGVNSLPLGGETVDETGWNKGLYELASGQEICAYFDVAMQRLQATGRVSYLPGCDYLGDGQVQRTATGETFEVAVRRRTVDASYMGVMVPSMRPPPYEVAPGVACAPPNALPGLFGQYERFTVVGAGKTGIDACLWLLGQGVPDSQIAWIMPRDSWLLDRVNIQPGGQFAAAIGRGLMGQAMAVFEATSAADLLMRLEACGQLLRLTPDVQPTMYRCATVSRAELEALRTLTGIVRLGRVQAIDTNEIRLDGGAVPTSARTLHIDCSADGLGSRPAVPVFEDGRITLQPVRFCQQVFSAAFIAHVEAAYPDDDTARNRLTTPIPHPDTVLDWLRINAVSSRNSLLWEEDQGLRAWLAASRLDIGRYFGGAPSDPAVAADQARKRRAATMAQVSKLEKLLRAEGAGAA